MCQIVLVVWVRVECELVDIQQVIDNEGGGFCVMVWDWFYYSEQVWWVVYVIDDVQFKFYFVFEWVL